jgi:hypothetical protein
MEWALARRPIHHISVRPVDEPYDALYCHMNKQTCLDKPWQPGYPVHQYIDGKIEDHDHLLPNDTVIYSIIDTHYYLNGWIPAN